MRHAELAHLLIEEVGIKRAAEICRIKKSRLYLCMQPHSGAFLPIDVVHVLERACGRRIYTDALEIEWHRPATQADLRTEVEELTEVAAIAMRVVRMAQADGELTKAEKRKIRNVRDEVYAQLREFSAVVDEVAA